MNTFMKIIALAVGGLIFVSTQLYADFSEPFTDSPAGKMITARGCLIADPGEKSGFSVLVVTDAGHRFLSAEISTNLNVQAVLGRGTDITATIREDRSLMIVDFPKSIALTNQVSPTAASVNVETSASSLLDVIKKRPDSIKVVYLTGKVSSVELKNGITLYPKSIDRQRELFDEGGKANIQAFWGR